MNYDDVKAMLEQELARQQESTLKLRAILANRGIQVLDVPPPPPVEIPPDQSLDETVRRVEAILSEAIAFQRDSTKILRDYLRRRLEDSDTTPPSPKMY